MLLHDTAIPSIDFCVSMRLLFATYEELVGKTGLDQHREHKGVPHVLYLCHPKHL